MKLNKIVAAGLGLLFVLGIVAMSAQAMEIRWGTSRVGSSGHRALTNLTQVLSKEMPEHQFTVQPTPGAIISVKGYATGEFEGYYGSDIAFFELANSIKRFKGFKEQMKRQPVQSFWCFTVESGVAIHARNKGKFTSWGDLTGKRVFTGPRPWDTRAQLERAFDTLGVQHEYMEVDIKTAGSLLESDRYTALGVYTNAVATTAPWITEATLQTDWVPLNPSAAEIAKLKSAGFSVIEVDPKVFGNKTAGAGKSVLLPFYYGLHVGLEVPENDVYRMLKVIEANTAELAKVDKGFKQIADDMVGMQVKGINSAVDLVPIHPGLAKYLREKGAWNSKWDSRIAKP